MSTSTRAPEFPEFFAHSENPSGTKHPLGVHLRAVGALAERFGGSVCGLAGRLHDLGKFSDEFQRRLNGVTTPVEHATAGAFIALTHYRSPVAALAVLAHHRGLEAGIETLRALRAPKNFDAVICRAKEEDIFRGLSPMEAQAPRGVAGMLEVRMALSALVDADYLDTEAHFDVGPGPTGQDGPVKRYRPEGPVLDIDGTLARLLSWRASKASEPMGPASALRASTWDFAEALAESPVGVFDFQAPTGSGKTLATFFWALLHARKHNLRRIIIAIPHLAIADQTARALREFLPAGSLLVHTSSAEWGEGRVEGDRDGTGGHRPKFRSENWDMPVILTTHVQLFESLFARRPRALRKIHRVAESCIVVDEWVSLKENLREATREALEVLALRYRTSTVLVSPMGDSPSRLSTHPSGGLSRFQGSLSWSVEDVPPTELDPTKSTLVVVNTRRRAAELFQGLPEAPGVPRYHISTSMCQAHRLEVFGRIKGHLARGEVCHVISTQCIESGVDLDFPVVFRAMAPLEGLIQAMGRCNRERRLREGDYRFCVFEDPHGAFPDLEYRSRTDLTRLLLQNGNGNGTGPLTSLWGDYLSKVRETLDLGKDALKDAVAACDFVEVDRLYRLIRRDGRVHVLVSWDSSVYSQLLSRAMRFGVDRAWMRRAQRHVVDAWASPGFAELPEGEGFWFYSSEYDPDLGLITNRDSI